MLYVYVNKIRMFAICVNTSCNVNKFIEHERASVMVVSFEANGENYTLLCVVVIQLR